MKYPKPYPSALAFTLLALSALGVSGCTKKAAQAPSTDPTPHASEAAAEYYTCPMHPEVRSDHPGKCPICHMTLVKRVAAQDSPTKPAEKAPVEKKIKYYRNPMDPSVHSDHPTKDSMGMDYIPVYETENESPRGSFSLTPEQLKLSGTKVIEVEKRDLTSEIRVPGRVLGGTRVSFQAFEQDSAVIKPGLEFEAETPTYPGQKFTGKITFVDSILDPMTRTLRVDGALSNTGKTPLRTEASVIGKIKVRIPETISVPESSVLHRGDRDLVYVSDSQNGFSPRVVVLGVKAGGFYEVKLGLSAGEKISSGPNFLLDSESRIELSQ